VSRHHPVFRPLEDYKPGRHCGLFSNLHKHSNRGKVVAEAERVFGCDKQGARMVAFITWLVELGYLTDDPSVPPVRVQQMRPHDVLAYWTLGEGVVEFERDQAGRWCRASADGQSQHVPRSDFAARGPSGTSD
jgi:hypothetical protein